MAVTSSAPISDRAGGADIPVCHSVSRLEHDAAMQSFGALATSVLEPGNKHVLKICHDVSLQNQMPPDLWSYSSASTGIT